MTAARNLVAIVILFAGVGASTAFAQNAPAADTPDAHLRLAKNAAGFDFLGTLGRLCVLPQTGPGADVAPGPAPARETWYTEPGKVFDNLYFVGGKVHSAWALTTSDGIILIDTIYPYNSEELIVGGMQKLGLDPKQVKYTIITHGHGDHVGGAKMMQERFGSRIVMGQKDWEFVENSVNRYGQGPTSVKPKRDIVAEDGQKLTLGDTTVTLVYTPGHTEGTFSMFFDVKDNGKPLTVAYSGGTAFTSSTRSTTSRPISIRNAKWSTWPSASAPPSLCRTIPSSTTLPRK
jgi:metallo-beta-lactamase class B